MEYYSKRFSHSSKMGTKHLSHIFFDFLQSTTVGYNGIKLLVRCCSLCKILKKVLYNEENPQKQPLNDTLLINCARYEMCFFLVMGTPKHFLSWSPCFSAKKQSPANSQSVPNLRIQSSKTLPVYKEAVALTGSAGGMNGRGI